MFKQMIGVFVLALVFAVQGASSTASQAAESSQSAKRTRPRVALAFAALSEERWHRDLRNMVEQAEKMGIDLIIQVATNDQNQQNFNLEQLITQGVDVLIINPHDSYGVGKIVEDARAAGIKVISYDRLIMNSPIDLYVSYDNLEVGRLQGRFLAEHAKKGNYILLSGPKYDSNAQFYKDGAMRELQPLIDRGDIKAVFERDVPDWNPNTTKELVETVLATQPQGVDAVLTPNDGMAMGAISALRQYNLQGKVFVTGQDANVDAARRVLAGSQSMTVFKDIAKEVEAALQGAIMLAKGEDITTLTKGRVINNAKHDVPAVLLEPVLLDKSNLNDVLLKAGHITERVTIEDE